MVRGSSALSPFPILSPSHFLEKLAFGVELVCQSPHCRVREGGRRLERARSRGAVGQVPAFGCDDVPVLEGENRRGG